MSSSSETIRPSPHQKRLESSTVGQEFEEEMYELEEESALLASNEPRAGRSRSMRRTGQAGTGTKIRRGLKHHLLRSSNVRTLFLVVLSAGVIVLLLYLFGPSKEYYGGFGMTPGTYSEDSEIGDNPLPEDAKFGDIPFAAVGGSKDDKGVTPEWAGGDGGLTDASDKIAAGLPAGKRFWNGTHWYEKTVIMISLDGLRTDYLDRGKTPHLHALATRGLRSQFLKPVFPSLTFPNHYSMLTGLYPAAHGIVANDFYDPETGKEFVYTDPTKSWAPHWWRGEPVWASAVKAGVRSAVLMWPGPPEMADGTRPTHFYAYEKNYAFEKKAARIAEWLDLPLATRPQLILGYAPEIDQQGHRSGPQSSKLDVVLHQMDGFAEAVMSVVDSRNLSQIVDVVFVSDHGMTSTANERLVFLDDILGNETFNAIERNEGWPSAGLRFREDVDTSAVLQTLRAASRDARGGFSVHTHETMPEKWHFTGSDRIAPIYVIPEVGWAISDRHDYHIKMNGDYRPKGNHGYDNDHPDMHAIFIGAGPFADTIRQKKEKLLPSSDGHAVIPGFMNLELYNLVMNLLDVPTDKRAPTNGTVGFWEEYLG